jgi:hypothetical protein
MRTARSALALRWLPVAAGAAYVATVVVLWHELIESNNWDTDVSGPLALADRLRGAGPVSIPHYGEWTTFWWLLATRWVPGHDSLWDASGYVLAVATAVVLGLATAKVAGRWAGFTAGATALLVGPFALRALLSLASHVTTPVGAVVLAAAVVALTQSRSWLLVIVVGVIAGTNAASDGLLWFAGVVPFALAAGVLARTTRRRDVALRAAAIVGVTVVSALLTGLVMRALDFHVIGLDVRLAGVHHLPENVRHLARMIVFLGGANYAIPGPYPRDPVRAVLAVLAIAGIAAPLIAAVRLRHAAPALRAYAIFWAAAVTALCLVFVATPNALALGPKSANYLLALAPAAGVGVALLAARSHIAQLVVALAVAFVGAVNVASIVDGRASGTPAVGVYAPAIREVLERRGATRGYAGYWDAQNLSWQSDMKLLVAPVVNCDEKLCPYNFFTVRSWYERRGGPTFLLVDPTNAVIQAPQWASTAAETHRFGPLTLYVFDYDIASRIRTIPPS